MILISTSLVTVFDTFFKIVPRRFSNIILFSFADFTSHHMCYDIELIRPKHNLLINIFLLHWSFLLRHLLFFTLIPIEWEANSRVIITRWEKPYRFDNDIYQEREREKKNAWRTFVSWYYWAWCQSKICRWIANRMCTFRQL